MKKLSLNENFICRIWENSSYYKNLLTTDGEQVEVQDIGIRNKDAGPDYKNAVVKIGGALFCGSVEIHRSMKDWFQHKHKRDGKYNDLVLQVVMWEDGEKILQSDRPKVRKARYIPTVILSKFLTRSIHEIWKEIIDTPSEKFRLPCYPHSLSVDNYIKEEWITALSMKRLNYKKERFRRRLAESGEVNRKISWEKMMFEYICEALGYSKNKEQFLKLSGKINLQKVKRMNPGRKDIDSILFGLAGFLSDLRVRDEYVSELKEIWSEKRINLREESMLKAEWNFFRLRPSNFPTLRIAYASGVLFAIIYKELFRKIIETFKSSGDTFKDAERIFMQIPVSDYWQFHYNFGKESSRIKYSIGSERFKDIFVNVLIPLSYLYSEIFSDAALKEKTIKTYFGLRQRKGCNEVSRLMEAQVNLKTQLVRDEQGLLHLHNFYCMKGKCRDCGIGKIVFSNETVLEPLRIILY